MVAAAGAINRISDSAKGNRSDGYGGGSSRPRMPAPPSWQSTGQHKIIPLLAMLPVIRVKVRIAEMSFCRLAVVATVLIGIAGPGDLLLAQDYTKPVPPQLSDAFNGGEQQPVLRPPRGVGQDDSDLTG